MGVDMHITITKYNAKTNLYEKICLYKDTEKGMKEVSIYPGRNYEMFEGMKHGDSSDGYGNFPWEEIALISLEDTLKARVENIQKIDGYYDFYEISLADMKIYCTNHPFVRDYDYEDDSPKAYRTNPIKNLYDEIYNYISFADEGSYWTALSKYKILFWFDC